jgi:hypothetical protein
MRWLAPFLMALTACSSAALEVTPPTDPPGDTGGGEAGTDTSVADTALTDTTRREVGDETITSDALPPVEIGAFHLDGTGGGELSKASDLYPGDAFTWELWFRGDALPTSSAIGRTQMLVVAADAGPCQDITLGFGSDLTRGDVLTFSVDGDGDCTTRNFTPVSFSPVGGFQNGRWYHVVAIRDYSNKRVALYVDGVVGAAEDYSRAPVTKALKGSVGRYSDESVTNAWFKGAIDELRFYNRRLTTAEITAHYGAGKGHYGLAGEIGLLGGFHFDEPSGSTAYAYSTTSRQITFSGGVTQVKGIVPAPP